MTMAWVGEQGLDHESQDDLTRLFEASSSGHADRTEAHAATNSRRVGRINVDEYVTREAQLAHGESSANERVVVVVVVVRIAVLSTTHPRARVPSKACYERCQPPTFFKLRRTPHA